MWTDKPGRLVTLGVALAGGVLLAACLDGIGPPVPGGTERLDPLPAEFAGWWAMVERCSGRRGNMEAIEWRLMPGSRTLPGTGGASGLYSTDDHMIVIAERLLREGSLVRHEMLHALQRHGKHNALFVEQCGGIVSCGTVCSEETETPGGRDPTAPFVGADGMEITLDVVPDTVSLGSATRGCVTFVVNARNPAGNAVRVSVIDAPSLGFSWRVEGFGGGTTEAAGGPADLQFAPNEIRRYSFDCPRFVPELEPGQYLVRGTFLGAESAPVPMMIAP